MTLNSKNKCFSTFRKIGRSLGFEIFRSRSDHHYVIDYYGRSAGKHIDIRRLEPFGLLAREVIDEGRTLLYYDRLYVHYQAIEHVVRLFFPRLCSAEIGVYKGGTSKFIVKSARALGAMSIDHYGFDTFEGHHIDDVSKVDTFQKPGFFADVNYEAVGSYLQSIPEVSLYRGRVQHTAARVEHNRFHFVHLDLDIYEPTAFALDFFGQRLCAGGVIIVDDYGFSTCSGVRMAVREFIVRDRSFFCTHHLSGQAVLVKTDISNTIINEYTSDYMNSRCD